MNSLEIDRIVGSLKDLKGHWAGVHGSDFVLRLLVDARGLQYWGNEGRLTLKLPKLLILNADETGMPGSHWLAFYVPKEGPLEFFDPLGHAPETYQEYWKYWLDSSERSSVRNASRYQDDDSSSCGQFCIFFGVLRLMGLSMKDVLRCLKTDDLIANEIVVDDFMKLLA